MTDLKTCSLFQQRNVSKPINYSLPCELAFERKVNVCIIFISVTDHMRDTRDRKFCSSLFFGHKEESILYWRRKLLSYWFGGPINNLNKICDLRYLTSTIVDGEALKSLSSCEVMKTTRLLVTR